MARRRTIDPDLWTDERVQRLPSVLAVALYIGTISMADDEGRLEWSPRQLWSRVFPAREDVRLRDIEIAMSAIADVRLVVAYTLEGRTYAVHPHWKKYQFVSRPQASRLPAPPPHVLLPSETIDVAVAGAQLPDLVKQQVAERYGCIAGTSVDVACACGEPGRIERKLRADGRPSSWVRIERLEWEMRDPAHVVAATVDIACAACIRARQVEPRAGQMVAPERGDDDDPSGADAGQTRGSDDAPLGRPSVPRNGPAVAPQNPASPRVPLDTDTGTDTGASAVALDAREVRSPIIAFGGWFLQAGIDAGRINAAMKIHPGALGYALAHTESIDALLRTHDLEEIKTRANRLFAWKGLRAEPSPAMLLKFWTAREIAAEERVSPAVAAGRAAAAALKAAEEAQAASE